MPQDPLPEGTVDTRDNAPRSLVAIHDAANEIGIPADQLVDMAFYLDSIPPQDRALRPINPSTKQSVHEASIAMSTKYTAAQYMATLYERVPKELRDKYATADAWQVPFECRPYVEAKGGI